MASLRTTLPTTFRINGSGKFAEDLRNQLETDFLASFTQGPVKVRPCDSTVHSGWLCPHMHIDIGTCGRLVQQPDRIDMITLLGLHPGAACLWQCAKRD